MRAELQVPSIEKPRRSRAQLIPLITGSAADYDEFLSAGRDADVGSSRRRDGVAHSGAQVCLRRQGRDADVGSS